MIIGIPKEIKNNENRVALTPAGARELVKRGHTVYVQATAGVNSGFADEAYTAVGAEILPTIGEVYARAEMIVKVKEPVAPEYKLIRRDQLVFTFFHFASSEPLTRAMVDSGAVCCAYETVERADRSLPLLIPMSEVAGRMAAQEGTLFPRKTPRRQGRAAGRRAGREARQGLRHRCRRGRHGRGAHRCRDGGRRDDLRHFAPAPHLPGRRDAPATSRP